MLIHPLTKSDAAFAHRFSVCLLTVGLLFSWAGGADAQPLPNAKHVDSTDRFYQIDSWLPTPDEVRLASGAPGPQYWQQRADYEIDVTLDDQDQRIDGVCKITYHNKSPHTLSYLWVQLEQNMFQPNSDAALTSPAPAFGSRYGFKSMQSILAKSSFDGGYKISAVTDGAGKELSHSIVKTMMRIDLPKPLAAGQSTTFKIDYSFNIVDAKLIRARSGYEYFKDDDNYLYEMAQWFPRVVSYTDYSGWQHKQFLGRGEFTLELGDYKVRITVPANMVVASTGVLQNSKDVLKPEWRERLKKATSAEKPVLVITPDEAKANESERSKETKTWVYHADNVRDFAFAASRKFIWDAMGVKVDDQTVMAMSYYPNEGNPLWEQYSTESIVHTLDVYGRYAFPYPYPIAISVNGPVYGMEYPMICFNGPRPESDGTYSRSTKYALISVIIHEVGHNFFPMIVNSDERQWTWMDEGLNTFLQYLTEQEWEEDYPSRRGPPEKIVSFMRGGNQRPIMTGSEEILQFGSNAYSKPATALNILRETILGREQFDFAFREYATRWRFKRPTPADFFRTMEDASGTDLDWFWRGWFYSTDHVDIGIKNVRLFQIDSGDLDEAAERKRQQRDKKEPTLSNVRNKDLKLRSDWQPGLKDYYNSDEYDPDAVEDSARKSYQRFLDGLDSDERSLLRRKTNFYIVDLENVGGLVMPVIIRLNYSDSSSEIISIPAEIWRSNGDKVSKLFISDKEITQFEIDPRRETADADESNNFYPPRLIPSRFKLYKSSISKNEMQKAGLGKEKDSDKDAKEDESKDKDGAKKDADKSKATETNGGSSAKQDAQRDDAKTSDTKSAAKKDSPRKEPTKRRNSNRGKSSSEDSGDVSDKDANSNGGSLNKREKAEPSK